MAAYLAIAGETLCRSLHALERAGAIRLIEASRIEVVDEESYAGSPATRSPQGLTFGTGADRNLSPMTVVNAPRTIASIVFPEAKKLPHNRRKESVMVSWFRTDASIKKDVEDEIKYDPSIIDDSHIAVAVKDGVVTLTGFVKRYMDSYYAEKAAKRVSGVKGVANDIEVKLAVNAPIPRSPRRPSRPSNGSSGRRGQGQGRGEERLADTRGRSRMELPEEWAERAVRSITGVKGVTNMIVVKTKVTPTE